jgi:CubicO group peptidase (beta-lactamase class C family)
MPFAEYLAEAVLGPLGMIGCELRGSAAHSARATVDDMVRFLAEVQRPTLVHESTATDAIQPQYPDLAGIVPGVGRFDPCPWGLGLEIRGDKSPHWTGRTNSSATVGHFGGAGTMMWVDPVAGCGLVALTDRAFDDWSVEAMKRWPELSDAVVSEVAG